jgi:O-antigen ligase
MLDYKTFNIKDLIKRGGLTFFSCLLTVIILPVHVDFLPPVMILWLITWIVENHRGFKKIWSFKDPAVLLFAGFSLYFAWYVSGLLYTEDLSNGILLIFRRLSFMIFPFVLITPGELIKGKVKFLLRVFSLSTLAYILFSFGLAIFRSIYLINGSISFNPHPLEADYNNYFFGTDFALIQHPTYLAMYVILSVCISFEAFFDKKLQSFLRIGWLLSGFVLLISLYFLSSRTGIISAFIIIPFYLIIHFKRFKKWWISGLIALAAASMLVIFFLNNERIKYYFPDNSVSSVMEKFMLDNRVPIWKSSINVIKHNLVLGVGAGDASYELQKEYLSAGYSEMYYNNLNAHDQYLEILLGTGLIGLLIFACIISYMVYIAIKRRNLFLGLFLFIVLIFFLFESILNRIAGVTFFALFSFLLIHIDEKSIFVRSSD